MDLACQASTAAGPKDLSSLGMRRKSARKGQLLTSYMVRMRQYRRMSGQAEANSAIIVKVESVKIVLFIWFAS